MNPIANNPALIQIMTWRRIGDTPLTELKLTWLGDAALGWNGIGVKIVMMNIFSQKTLSM